MKLFFLFTVLLVSTSSEAATFNYIFNNVEQGENSTSSPSIVVDGEKITKNNGEAVTTSSLAAGSSVSPESNFSRPLKYRLMAMGSIINNRSSENISFQSTKHDIKGLNWEDRSTANATLSGSVFTGRDMAIGAFWVNQKKEKAHYGAEMEFIPVRVAVLGKYDFIETGILLGASTIGRDILKKSGTFHAGLRASVNFHSQLGITGAVRSNLNERSNYRYTMAEVGLAYRF